MGTTKFTPSYYMMPPELFILNHFSNDSSWQLLDPPMHMNQWLSYPSLGSALFSSHLNRYDEPICPSFSPGQTVKIRIARGNFKQLLTNRNGDNAPGEPVSLVGDYYEASIPVQYDRFLIFAVLESGETGLVAHERFETVPC